MHDHDESAEQVETSGLSRRTLIKRAGVGAAAVWSVPLVTSMTSPAYAASSSNPHPECAPATCGNFVNCTSQNPDCVCVSFDNGGGDCVPGSTACSSLSFCNTSSDCPSGSFCAVNTCCGTGVCIPPDLSRACPPDSSSAHANTTRKSSGPGTLGG